MKKKITVWIMAMAAALSLTMPVAASVRGNGRAVNFMDVNADGICDYFKDADKNGICDHCTVNAGRGRQFVDKNNDGICDHFTGIGNGCGKGYRRRINKA